MAGMPITLLSPGYRSAFHLRSSLHKEDYQEMVGNSAAYLWLVLLVMLCVGVAFMVERKINVVIALLTAILVPVVAMLLLWAGIAPN